MPQASWGCSRGVRLSWLYHTNSLKDKWMDGIAETGQPCGATAYRASSNHTRSGSRDVGGHDTCTFDDNDNMWTNPLAFVVMTQSDLSTIQRKLENEELRGKFDCICVDECQGFQRTDPKKVGALNCFEAPYKHCFSATICHDSLADLRGIILRFYRAD